MESITFIKFRLCTGTGGLEAAKKRTLNKSGNINIVNEVHTCNDPQIQGIGMWSGEAHDPKCVGPLQPNFAGTSPAGMGEGGPGWNDDLNLGESG